MTLYRYEAVNAEGATLGGEVRGESPRQAMRVLEQRGLSVVELQPAAARRLSGRRRRLAPSDVILALQELATMLTSGVPVADAVASQAASAHHPGIVKAFSSMAAGLQRGQSFSTVLDASGLPLPEYVGQLVRAGELTGELGKALQDAGQQLEYEQRVRNEVRNALVYPAVLVVAGVAAVALMFLFVVPKFESMLGRADDLPFLAWLVLSTGVGLRENFMVFVLVLAAAIGGAVYLLRQPRWRAAGFDRVAAMPLIGDWLVEADTARWAKVLAVLLGNRVPLMRALELAQGGLQIPERRTRMTEVTRAVRGGSPLAVALEDHDALTATGYNLVRVGERSGKLAPMLDALARLYEEAGRNRMKRLLVLIEPLAILVIGSVIGTIILGVILAITSANDLAI